MQLQCSKSYFEFNISVNDLIAAFYQLFLKTQNIFFHFSEAGNVPFELCVGTVGRHFQDLSSL